MSLLVHIIGTGSDALAPLDGHLLRNVEWDRFTLDSLDEATDAVILSAATTGNAIEMVITIRRVLPTVGIILIPQPSVWPEALASDYPDVAVVPDISALGAHLNLRLHDVIADQGTEPPGIDLRRHVPRGGGRGLLRERLGDGGESISRSMRDFDRSLVRELAEAHVDERPPLSTQLGRVTDELPLKLINPPSDVSSPRGARTRRSEREKASPESLVAGLLDVSERLYGVRETGTAVAGHVKDAVGIDAVAVLIPDGQLWTIVGAIGHRHLEERLSLSEDHWLVQEVSGAHHGVVIEDTDIARNRLAGAPLAAWPHLMSCPLPDVRGLVILARSSNGPPFTARDLGHASTALVDADSLFRTSLQLRELARRLRTFAELEDV